MKVIVKKAGWYGGNYYEVSDKEQEMPKGVAVQFLSPYGDQLEKPKDGDKLEKPQASRSLVKTNENKTSDKAG